MTNLFSVFDPCTGSFSLNWLSSIIFLIIIPIKFWFLSNKIYMLFLMVIKKLMKETFTLLPYKSLNLMLMSLFMFIVINNLMGLLPYIFTSTSHLVNSLTLALPIWISMMIYGWSNKHNSMFSHLVPSGTPSILMPFMVMIETVSNIIRPGSLAVRLTANMIAGHLLMSLLGNSGCKSAMIMMSILIIFMVLMLFELAVALIQAYVFMTLSTLYYSEI